MKISIQTKKINRSLGRVIVLSVIVSIISNCTVQQTSTGAQSVVMQNLAVPGFSFDCQNTAESPCRTLTGSYRGSPVDIEPSSIVWSDRFKKVVVVSDNFNDLVEQNAAHFVISAFKLDATTSNLAVEPVL